MAAISHSRLNNNPHAAYNQQHGVITEEIQGLIRVHKDGYVERPPIVPNVSCSESPSNVTSRDIMINKDTNLWARLYIPSVITSNTKLPLIIYFHGGGFCVGSASWSCYHDFLTNLASKANCVILSVNYNLAPESRLPTAYDDGVNAIMWVKQEALNNNMQRWWLSHINLSSIFLAGDSAGGNIAYNVFSRISSNTSCAPTKLNPLSLKGIILIQPFFGGEERTNSEKQYSNHPPNSALTLSASDTYWRLALPMGANRDHPYCNPLAYYGGSVKLRDLRIPATMVCVSELDILKDRNLEFSNALAKAGKKVETSMYRGVGHAFQVLHNSHLSHARAQEMINHIRNFLTQN